MVVLFGEVGYDSDSCYRLCVAAVFHKSCTVTLFVCRLLLSALCRQQGAVCTLQCTVATVSKMMDEARDFSSYLFVCSSVCRCKK